MFEIRYQRSRIENERVQNQKCNLNYFLVFEIQPGIDEAPQSQWRFC